MTISMVQGLTFSLGWMAPSQMISPSAETAAPVQCADGSRPDIRVNIAHLSELL